MKNKHEKSVKNWLVIGLHVARSLRNGVNTTGVWVTVTEQKEITNAQKSTPPFKKKKLKNLPAPIIHEIQMGM